MYVQWNISYIALKLSCKRHLSIYVLSLSFFMNHSKLKISQNKISLLYIDQIFNCRNQTSWSYVAKTKQQKTRWAINEGAKDWRGKRPGPHSNISKNFKTAMSVEQKC